jgi:hypothetical protein
VEVMMIATTAWNVELATEAAHPLMEFTPLT